MDICLDGPKYANVVRYTITNDNYVSSFNIEKCDSFTGKSFGYISNIRLKNKDGDVYEKTYTVAFSEDITSLRLARTVTTAPEKEDLFLLRITQEMSEETKEKFIKDIVAYFGANGEMLQRELINEKEKAN